MSRKSVYSREMVLDAAVEIFKTEGYEKITVKRVAQYLGCSIAPVYSAYTSMEDLKKDVVQKVEASLEDCFSEETIEKNRTRTQGISEEQEGFFKRMFIALAPEDEALQKKFKSLVFSALQGKEEEENTRAHLFHIFMRAISLIEEIRPQKLNRREILSLIARHKRYILTLRNKKCYDKKRK